jgi:hypothetical protein
VAEPVTDQRPLRPEGGATRQSLLPGGAEQVEHEACRGPLPGDIVLQVRVEPLVAQVQLRREAHHERLLLERRQPEHLAQTTKRQVDVLARARGEPRPDAFIDTSQGRRVGAVSRWIGRVRGARGPAELVEQPRNLLLRDDEAPECIERVTTPVATQLAHAPSELEIQARQRVPEVLPAALIS